MKLLGILTVAGALACSSPVLAAGIDGSWNCRHASSPVANVTINGTGYTLETPDGQHGSGSFAFALPDESAFNLDGYLADRLHVVGGILRHTMMNSPELQLAIAGGDEILCIGAN